MDADQLEGFDALAVSEVLDADSRPTFVIDLDPDEPFRAVNTSVTPVFCNAALRSHERLLDAVLGNAADHEPRDGRDDQRESLSNSGPPPHPARVTHEAFKQWATGVTTHDDSKDVYPLSFTYWDLLWTGSTVGKRWRIVSGNRLWRADGAPLDLASGAPLEVATGGSLAKRRKMSRLVTSEDHGSVARASETNKEGTSSKLHTSSSPLFYPRLSAGDSSNTGDSSHLHSQNRSLNISSTLTERAAIDWTVPQPEGRLSEHLQYVRSVDWGATSLGPMEQWTVEFRQIANLVMMNLHPCALFCGSKLTVIYNEAYANEVAGNKHPTLMGADFADFFPELWDYCGPMFEKAGRTGISVRKDNDYLPIYRHGMLEETYYSWTYVPIYSSNRELLGFYNGPVQTTSMILNQRRMRTVNKIGENTGHAKTMKQFWKLVLGALEDNPRDVPFALLYSVGEDDDGDFSSTASEASISLKSCHFEGALGVPEGHVAVPQQLDLRRSLEGFVPSFREAMRTREPTLLRVKDGTLPEALLEGIKWRGFGDPCREAIIFPVRPTNADNVLAFLVLGVNPRRPYDHEYMEFATMFNRQLATSLASTILFEEETRRINDAVEAAMLERERLTQQLDLQASRLRRMTELSPLGMFLITPEGVLREVNDRFFEMTGLPRASQFEMSWMEWIMPGSTQQMEDGWHRLANEHLPWSGELQLKIRGARPRNLHGEDIDYWVLFTAQPEISSEGALLSIMGSITDISHMKWAQGLQELQLREAEETRRQQNEFIDITSHEMRNPLSAILQCADDVTSALTECRAKAINPSTDIVESCLESAQTISLCVQHQKSIVDDILTISKLDSNLLLITPVASQPEQVLSRAVKMFESELQAKDIKAQFEIHPTYKQLAVDWVTLDPSRVLQILINLLTNAIKFTAPSAKRVLTVGVDASLEPPVLKTIPGFQYVPTNNKTSTTACDDWGEGQILYISFRVQDTGCGLTAEEKQILFQRFKQASPRTHAQYGGSGLGLFISKRIAELHSGQIGVASEAGSGSIFSFYIQGRRSLPPVDSQQANHVLPIERHMNGDVSLRRQLAPQRQDVATAGGLGANLLATKARRALDPRDLNILIVEDNLINQRVLANQLKKTGATVSLANDGIEALEFLRTTRFCGEAGGGGGSAGSGSGSGTGSGGAALDVILMDLEMPRMDGLTCVREIRRMEGDGEVAGHVPVIAVTANVRAQQVTTAKDSGMDDVLSKPFRIPDLLKMVEALLLAAAGDGAQGS